MQTGHLSPVAPVEFERDVIWERTGTGRQGRKTTRRMFERVVTSSNAKMMKHLVKTTPLHASNLQLAVINLK